MDEPVCSEREGDVWLYYPVWMIQSQWTASSSVNSHLTLNVSRRASRDHLWSDLTAPLYMPIYTCITGGNAYYVTILLCYYVYYTKMDISSCITWIEWIKYRWLPHLLVSPQKSPVLITVYWIMKLLTCLPSKCNSLIHLVKMVTSDETVCSNSCWEVRHTLDMGALYFKL